MTLPDVYLAPNEYRMISELTNLDAWCSFRKVSVFS
jgi:hypothetical protein